MIGHELALTPGTSRAERLYIRLLGAPINGLRIRLRRVLPHCTGNPSAVLDAGCGRGVFSYQLARRFPSGRIVGVDIDDDRLSVNQTIAARAGLSNLRFDRADVADLGFSEAFDLVVSVDNLEHLEDDQAGLDSLCRALKPGGRLVLHVPGYERRWPVFAFATNFDVPGHFRPGYWLPELKERVVQAGLNVLVAEHTFGWLETISNNISYWITGAEAKNKAVYALAFPLLNAVSWLGRNANPKRGAGVLIVAEKRRDEP